jgi:hypothetical protein
MLWRLSVAINLHPAQSEIYRALFIDRSVRYATVCCARGWGKSYKAAVAAISAIFELLELPYSVPNKKVYIIAPTFDQVKDIYYPLINYDLGMEHYAIKASRDTGRFLFPGNVELILLSFESVERMRGKGAYFVVWDEVSSCTKGITAEEAWQSVIQPTIATRWSNRRAKAVGAKSPGRALAISTPKGYNFFHEMCMYHETDPDWGFWQYDYLQSPFLDPVEIEKLKDKLDPVTWASEYMASFAESGNSVFYCFDRKKHVDAHLQYFEPGEDVHVCIDFNVMRQCSSIFALRGHQMQFIDEMQGHPDTEALAIALKTKFQGHKIYAYPDPSGRARKTSAPVGRTDFSILESNGIICIAHRAAPPIVDSVAAVNRKLHTASGKIDMYVHPRCSGTILSLERTKWTDRNLDIATIDKSEGIEHFSDGVRYAVEYLYPIQTGGKRTSRGFNF